MADGTAQIEDPNAGPPPPDPNAGAPDPAGTPPPEDDGGKPDGDDPTTLAGGGSKPDDRAAPAAFPDDWRKQIAGDDADLLKALDRVKSVKDLGKGYVDAQKMIRSGAHKEQAGPPKDATDEQMAAWREQNGIPKEPAGYFDKLPNGLVVAEADQEAAASFVEAAHKQNMPPEHVHAALGWYYETQEAALAAQTEADKAYMQKSEDELREEWGSDYRANLNAVTNFINATAPDEIRTQLMTARMADGSMLGNNPEALRWLSRLADDANPAGFVAPSDGTSQLQSVEAEIAEIEKFMRTNRAEYDKDDKKQARLRQLYEAQDRLSAKS